MYLLESLAMSVEAMKRDLQSYVSRKLFCARCNEKQFCIKAGKILQHQKFKCKECNYLFSLTIDLGCRVSKNRKWILADNETKDKYVNMYLEGASAIKLLRNYGVPLGVLSNWLAERGVLDKKRNHKQSVVLSSRKNELGLEKRVLELYEGNLRLWQIKNACGINVRKIYFILKKHNVKLRQKRCVDD